LPSSQLTTKENSA
jgi:hypothetical protein